MKLVNCTAYFPEDNPLTGFVQFCRSEDGRDFYESQPLFKKRWKFIVDSNQVIRSINEDVSMLNPVNHSLYELDWLPDGCNIDGGWMFDGRVVKPYPPFYVGQAEWARKDRLNGTMQEISLITGKIMLNIATDDEKAEFIAKSGIVDKLKAMDFSGVVDEKSLKAIIWPE